MTPPIATVVRVAATPAEAKVIVARLAAEGIPAHIDGDSLSDEVAVSRRLMNLNGTRVMVPTASLERAREILAAETVDETELEQQALAASEPERPSRSVANGARGKNPLVWPFVGASTLAIVFFVLWFDYVDLHASSRDPLFDFVERSPGVAEYVRRSDGVAISRYTDKNLNRIQDRIDTLARDGSVLSSSFDADQDGRLERLVVNRENGWTETWTDADADGIYEVGVVADAKGVVKQRLVWKAGTGHVIETP